MAVQTTPVVARVQDAVPAGIFGSGHDSNDPFSVFSSHSVLPKLAATFAPAVVEPPMAIAAPIIPESAFPDPVAAHADPVPAFGTNRDVLDYAMVAPKWVWDDGTGMYYDSVMEIYFSLDAGGAVYYGYSWDGGWFLTCIC